MSVLRSRLLPAVVALIAATGVVGVTDAGAAATKAPRVTSVSPSSGPVAGGTRITVHGSHLSGASSVTIGGVPGHKIHVLSARALTVVVPKHTVGRYSVRVRSAKGRSASTSHSTYGYVSRPSVSKVRLIKGSGLAGSTIRVTGKNLAKTRTVKVGRATARVVAHTSTTMDVRVPTNAPGRLHVTATTAGGTSSTEADDVYPMPAPVDQDWSTQTYLGIDRGQLADIDCPSASTCIAVDHYGDAWTIVDGRWSSPAHVAGTDYVSPDRLSCPDVDFCALTSAAGIFTYADGAWHAGPTTPDLGGRGNDISCASVGSCVWVGGNAFSVLTDGTWSTPVSTPREFTGISCFTASQCNAIGPGPSFYAFDGASWTELPAPPRFSVAASSCASPTLCAVVTSDGWASTWDGSTWAEPAKLEHGYDSFVAVSCVDATCVYNGRTAMHVYSGGSWTTSDTTSRYHLVGCHTSNDCTGEHDLGDIGSFDGSTWQTTTQRLLRVGPGSSIDCVNASFCAMSDEAGNAFVYDGTTWSAPHPVGRTYYLGSTVSCPSTNFCMAMFGDRATAIWDGTTWTTAPSAPHAAAAGLACFSPTNCIAAGRYGSERFDGTEWTVLNSTVYRSMSCGSADFCAAVTADEVQTFDGTRWHHAVDDSTLRYVDSQAIACPSEHFCLLIDGVGNEITYRSGTWSAPAATLSPFPMTVACSSASSCQALGFDRSQTFDGRNWSAINVSGDAVEASGASALSCYAPGSCIAADWGVIFASHPRG